MKTTEQYFPVALLIMMHKVVLSFESVEKILTCDHLSFGFVDEIAKPFLKIKAIERHFPAVLFTVLGNVRRLKL